MKKNILKIIPIFLMITLIFTSYVYCDTYNPSLITGDNPNVEATNQMNNAKKVMSKIVGTIMFVFQITAVGGVVYAGVRYMYAGAEAKSQLKKSLSRLAIGCAILFSASTITNLIIKSFNDAII